MEADHADRKRSSAEEMEGAEAEADTERDAGAESAAQCKKEGAVCADEGNFDYFTSRKKIISVKILLTFNQHFLFLHIKDI